MITLESLQVFPIKDGASGLVLATWIERSGVEGVPLRQHSILISSEEAQLLAQELNRVTEGVEESASASCTPMQCWCHDPKNEDLLIEGAPCSSCRCMPMSAKKSEGKEPGSITSCANLADLHMHGLTYFRGAHCSGQQSQHQQVAVSDV